MNLKFLLSLLFIIPFLGTAQFTVTGTSEDTNGLPLAFANVLLLKTSDSTFVSGATSDDNGTFELTTVTAGEYRVTVSVLGFDTYTSQSFSLSDARPNMELGTVQLSEGALALNEVQVVGSRPLIERKIDRLVVNVANKVNTAGSSALEILERSPGVVVNRQGNSIAMLGKEGVNVMVNGKLQYMPADALFSYLQGLDADNIQSLELITTPPANLDAQGNAGYINLVLKKNPDEGFNGGYSLSAGFGQGETGNASVNFNYRKNRINLFGSYSYLRNGQEQFTTLERRTGTGDDFTETLLTSDRNPTQNNHNYRLGLDIQASEKTTIGVLFSGYDNNWDMDALNITSIRPAVAPDTLAISRNVEINDWQHLQSNINLLHNFDNGATLNLDFDYLTYDNQNPITYDLSFEGTDGTLFDQSDLLSEKDTPFNILVGKADYSLPVGEKAKLSVGTKYVTSDFENLVALSDDGVTVPGFTSNSDLEEDIFAVYSQVDYQLSENTTLKGGLRFESSSTVLNSTNGGQVVDRQLDNLFPSIYWNQKLGEFSSFNLSYSRRINRPSFSDMAPFVIFLDPRTSFGGNAALRPALANTFQLDYTRKSVSLSAQYTDEDFTIVGFQNRFNPETNTQLIVPDNLEGQRTASLTLSFPVTVTDWWKMRYFSTLLWQESTTIEDLGRFTFDQTNFRINGNQTFTLGNDYTAELSGFYQTRSLVGNVKFEPLGILNFGIQKKFKNGSRLAFNITDVFNSLERIGITDIPEENIFIERAFDFSQRTFKLTWSASFGNKGVKKERDRKTGADEEKERVN
ncbi:TonB-dependent receptor domain-containing protein [Ulvibacterium marinum]|uniref:Outer membrane protein beta-barrel domain-containing protein n=1 Tax=Ulvibacterium marinum TaxID=2419782 RepID=A0A3B0CDV6_9FLAO|nr:TonB-dependent receptor [Ulvibacterium marinum]RKN83540.1 hypothetical protein D7Z94_06905 [Ulvibacterium marinum]